MAIDKTTSDLLIRRWADVVTGPGRTVVQESLDRIFFEASGTKTFASDEARTAFRERWMGRYLTHEPGWFYIAFGKAGDVAGYLAGAIDDPALSQRYADIGYFPEIAHLTRRYPAHLHINFAPECRGRGWGARLIERFSADATAAGATGVHVVTGRGMRNVGFYTANGFRELGGFSWNGRDLVVLGRELGSA